MSTGMVTPWSRIAILACAALSFGCVHIEEAPGPHQSRGRWEDKHRSRPAPSTPNPRDLVSWPLQGKISSGFGSTRGRSYHKGIDVRVSPGTPVRAAAAGRATFSGRMRGYGNVIILDHGGGLETRYAHNRRNRVRKGDRIEAGEVIAEVGSSGNATAPHLHFELRRGGRALDPLRFLPPSRLPTPQ